MDLSLCYGCATSFSPERVCGTMIFLLDSELPSNTSRLDVLNRPGTKSSTKRKIFKEHASVRTIRTAMAPRQ